MYLCEHCILEIKSRGEKVWIGDFHNIDEEIECEWCEEVDDVYECKFKD